MLQIRMRTDWEKIVGKTIAKYTQEVHLYNRILTITTTVAPLKQELRYAKDQLIQSINQHFGEAVVKEIQIK
jgi:predicted nucleic acid-binding Zn ribbon protein